MSGEHGAATELETLTGWGRTAPSLAHVVRARDADDVRHALCAAPPRGLLARGLGRSYSDGAQNAGGTVVDMTGVARVRSFDAATASITVDAGLSLDALMRIVLPLGFFVPVTPGTRLVTVGGAIANDIHGKNHHGEGSFGAHLTELQLLTPDGASRCIGPDREPELYWATVGGLGLTGVILSATIRLLPVETSRIRVDTERAEDLDDCMARMAERDDDYRYSVAWIDCLAEGRRLGRSVLTRGDHATVDELPARARRAPLAFDPKMLLAAPKIIPPGLLRRSTVRIFNEVWFRKAPKAQVGAIHSIGSFFHPLDGVRDWNRIYGPPGFVQYQMVIPFGEEETLRRMIQAIVDVRCPSFLAVLKRFGPEGSGLISFPSAGWTLALDIPTTIPGLSTLLERLDEMTVGADGRVYLAKDGRVRPDLIPVMYPRLDEWRAVVDKVDPAGRLQSDLSRRLHLR